MKHTALPWQILDFPKESEIQSKDNDIVCKFYHIYSNWPNDIEFIVRACNSHYDLLEALKFAKSVIQSGERWTETCEKMIDARIAKAEGK